MFEATPKKIIVGYWLLVLVPTIFISIASYQLLIREQQRLEAHSRETYLERTRLIAESVRLTVLSVQEALTDTLQGIGSKNLEESLVGWRDVNPLVRNVFLWHPEQGLLYPVKERVATNEERQFVLRYDAIFSGRQPWKENTLDNASPGQKGKTSKSATLVTGSTKYDLVEKVQNLSANRRELVGIAKKGATAPDSSLGRDAAQYDCGWRPWFMENQLHMLGWCRTAKDGRIYGVELEVMSLLSQIVSSFPAKAPPGLVYSLVDGNGLILHQTNGNPIAPGQEPELNVTLAPQLPHWQVGVYVVDEALANKSAGNFMLLSGLLVLIFLVAILSGGGLLAWQAIRHHKDARRKTHFVSNVSHELKTPLTSIRMYAELLQSGRVQDEGKKKKYLEVMVDESQRLTRLVNNVLDFSRLERKRKKYHSEKIDLVAFLRNFLETQRIRLEKAGFKAKVEASQSECMTYVDRDALDQVLLNLLDNAIKYAASGREMLFKFDHTSDQCRLRVMDRGPGVPKDQRRKIFEKFHRIDDSLTAQQPGSGLGLSIARRILRDMRGDLLYEDRQGGGGCFVLVLPRDAKECD